MVLNTVVNETSGSRESLALADADIALLSVVSEHLMLKYNSRNPRVLSKGKFLSFHSLLSYCHKIVLGE